MTDPVVSVCVPVFNGAGALERCLASVVDQCRPNYEIVVADNDSTDGTAALAERLLSGNPHGRVERAAFNVGRIGNWNRCLDVSRGRYVKFLMVNDVLLPGSLDLLMNVADQHPEAVIVSSMHRAWDGGAGEQPPVAASATTRRFTPAEALESVCDGGDPFWALNGMLIRREPVSRSGLRFLETSPYMADRHFCTHLSQYGETVFVETATYLFNMGAPGRFFYRGRQDEAYLVENIEYFREVERLFLAKHGAVSASVARRLERRLADGHRIWLASGGRAPLATVARLYHGRRRLQIRVLWNLLRCRSGLDRLAAGVRAVRRAAGRRLRAWRGMPVSRP
jgi:GT2 family glycosyltransferase